MDTSSLFTQLITYIRTKEEASLVKASLTAHLNSLYILNSQKDGFAQLPVTLSRILTQLFPVNAPLEQTKKQIDDLIKRLDSCLVVSVTLAYPATESTINIISARTREIFGKESLIDISPDPSIIGGIILAGNGTYRDYSIRKKLKLVLRQNKDELYKVLEKP